MAVILGIIYLDQLVRLGDKLGASLQEPGIGDLGLVEDALDVGIC